MDLRNLLPNKTLFWKEWLNNQTVFAIFLGFVTFASSITLLNEILTYADLVKQGSNPDYYNSYTVYNLLSFSGSGGLFGFVAVLLTVASAALLMGHERDQNTFNLLLAMPYSRRDLIYNKFLLGWGYLLTIFIFNALVMTVLVKVCAEIPFPFDASAIWAWALRHIVVLSFTFAFTMFISSISGTTLGNGIIALIFLYFPFGFIALTALNLEYWTSEPAWRIIHASKEISFLLTVPTYIMDNSVLWYRSLPPIYGVLLLLTGVLYQLTQCLFARNHLENNGEVLMFAQLEGFFKFGGALCFALLSGPLVVNVFNPQATPFLVAVSGLAAGIAFWFLVNWVIKWRKVMDVK